MDYIARITIEPGDTRACLAFAADRERKLMAVPPA